LVFIDADKLRYKDYYSLLLQHKMVRSGGLILADNVLWRGLVFDMSEEGQASGKEDKEDKRARAMVDFLDIVKNDDRVEMVLTCCCF